MSQRERVGDMEGRGPGQLSKWFTLTLTDLKKKEIKKFIKEVYTMNDVCDLLQNYLVAAGNGSEDYRWEYRKIRKSW